MNARRGDPHILVSHTGNLPRPADLEALNQSDGDLSAFNRRGRRATGKPGALGPLKHRQQRSETMTVGQTTQRAEELLPVTPSQIEGPYFRIGAPRRDSLLEPGITGERLRLSGKVVTPHGKAIPNAVLHFWLSDDKGNYDMVGYRLQGYTLADAKGRYHMEMIVPACYEPRQAKHVHVKVQGVSRPLTTQLFFSDDEDRLRDNWYLKELEVQVEDAPDGGKKGTFDFVIQQVTEKENVTAETLAARV